MEFLGAKFFLIQIQNGINSKVSLYGHNYYEMGVGYAIFSFISFICLILAGTTIIRPHTIYSDDRLKDPKEKKDFLRKKVDSIVAAFFEIGIGVAIIICALFNYFGCCYVQT